MFVGAVLPMSRYKAERAITHVKLIWHEGLRIAIIVGPNIVKAV